MRDLLRFTFWKWRNPLNKKTYIYSFTPTQPTNTITVKGGDFGVKIEYVKTDGHKEFITIKTLTTYSITIPDMQQQQDSCRIYLLYGNLTQIAVNGTIVYP